MSDGFGLEVVACAACTDTYLACWLHVSFMKREPEKKAVHTGEKNYSTSFRALDSRHSRSRIERVVRQRDIDVSLVQALFPFKGLWWRWCSRHRIRTCRDHEFV